MASFRRNHQSIIIKPIQQAKIIRSASLKSPFAGFWWPSAGFWWPSKACGCTSKAYERRFCQASLGNWCMWKPHPWHILPCGIGLKLANFLLYVFCRNHIMISAASAANQIFHFLIHDLIECSYSSRTERESINKRWTVVQNENFSHAPKNTVAQKESIPL